MRSNKLEVAVGALLIVVVGLTLMVAVLTYMLESGQPAKVFPLVVPDLWQAGYGQEQEQEQQPPLSPSPPAPILEFNQTMAKTVILAQLFQSNFTGADFYENGTAIYYFTYPEITDPLTGAIIPSFNFTVRGITIFTPEAGFRYENQTLYAPDGREIRVVVD